MLSFATPTARNQVPGDSAYCGSNVYESVRRSDSYTLACWGIMQVNCIGDSSLVPLCMPDHYSCTSLTPSVTRSVEIQQYRWRGAETGSHCNTPMLHSTCYLCRCLSFFSFVFSIFLTSIYSLLLFQNVS